jgi:hypothetical protein
MMGFTYGILPPMSIEIGEIINIRSKYLIVADEMPPDTSANILSGRLLSARITHGYVSDGYDGRLTQMVYPDGKVSLIKKKPNQGLLPGFTDPPIGVSSDVEYKEIIGEDEFNTEFAATKGQRIGKNRHVLTVSGKSGPGRDANIEIFRGDVGGAVPEQEIIAGRMIVVVHFDNLEEAQEFNEDALQRPKWFGQRITKAFSTKKLIRYLTGVKHNSSLGLLLSSASVGDLLKKSHK